MRYLLADLKNDLKKKMVFLSGPRQVGKTTLAKEILKSTKGLYLNWDDDDQKLRIKRREWKNEDCLLVLDEIHKFKSWRNYLKGTFDTQKEVHQFLITGSARLDVYRRGGDSLLGRYHHWRLHPFTIDESIPKMPKTEVLTRLMSRGGFPEPFFHGDDHRWRNERRKLILRDDLRDLERVQEISQISLLVNLLRERVSGLVVMSNLAEDIGVSSKSIRHWIEILERLYLVFTVCPYTSNLARAIQKPPKIYFFDNGDVVDAEGPRFENLVAAHLLKRIHYLTDRFGDEYELRYIRDKDGREVDFVVLKNGKVDELIEVKWSDSDISKSLIYYAEKLKPRLATQIVMHLKHSYQKGKLQVLTPIEYFTKFG
jgi:predicted AAA+ superfamily ATPase